MRLTEGSITKVMLKFALPIFLGNLFQQLYNASDSLIVGNFLGSESLAAITSTGSLIFLLIGFFNGVSIGAGVVIARYYGAKDWENLKNAVHTTVLFGVVCGLLMTVLGLVFSPMILRLMGTPENILPQSVTYLRIYFCGSLAFVLYNSCMGILQSVGDSKHPLYYLIISSVLNVILDLIFVGVFHYGVGAAALATIIAQFTSVFLCLYRLMKKSPEEYTLIPKEIKLHKYILIQILKNGIPTGLQNSIISIANVFVQSNINAFGSIVIAGCGIYSRIEGFAFLPVTCFSMALTTFISQNLGAGKYDRVKKGGYLGVGLGIIAAAFIGVMIYIFIPFLASLFTSDAEVIQASINQAHIVCLFFLFCAFSHCVSGLLRGAGKSAVPMYVMLLCWCFIRISYITVAVHFIPKIQTVLWAYPITWSISTVVFLIYFFRTDWVHGYQKQ